MQSKSYILMVVVMFLNLGLKKVSGFFTTLFVLIFAFSLILFSKECAEGAIRGILLSLKILIPTLFPFMVLSSFIIKSGLSSVLGKPFEKAMKLLFGLNKNFASVMILGMLGGYPVAAKGISSLYENGDASIEECKNASLYMVCAGPGFIINYVGVSLYSDKRIGVLLLFAQICSVIICGIINKITRKEKFCSNTKSEKKSNKSNNFCSSLVEAVYEGSKGIFTICSFVVLFSGITGMLCSLIDNKTIKNLILLLCEVCTAVNTLSKDSGIFAVAFAIGFGGLCVHFQIFSTLGKIKVNTKLFFLYSILAGTITGLIAFIGMKFFIGYEAVFSVARATTTGPYNGSYISATALIILMVCFLYTIKNTRTN